jgi:hypothetical protein
MHSTYYYRGRGQPNAGRPLGSGFLGELHINTVMLTPVPSNAEWYADSVAASHMISNTGNISAIQLPSSSIPSFIIVGTGSLLLVHYTRSHSFHTPHQPLFLNDVLV